MMKLKSYEPGWFSGFIVTIYLMLGIGNGPVCAQSVLWRIEGNNLNEPSYILGIAPLADPHTLNLNDTFFYCLNQCQSVAVTQQADSLFNRLDSSLVMPDDRSLEKMLNAVAFQWLDLLVSQYTGLTVWEFVHHNPIWLRQYLEALKLKQAAIGNLPAFVTLLAREQGKPVRLLSSAGWFQEMLTRYPFEMQADMLSSFFGQMEDQFREQYLYYYLNGDLAGLKNWLSQEEHYEYFLARYHDPVTGLAVDIQDLIHREPAFIMVDAPVIPGKNGLKQRLERMGYTLQPVETGLRYKGSFIPADDTVNDTSFVIIDSVVYYPLNTDFDDQYFRKNLPGWYPLVSYSGGFTAFMPEKPAVSIDRQAAPGGFRTIHLFKFEDRATNMFNTVSYSDYPPGFEVGDADEFFDQLIAHAVSSIGGILLVERNISTGYLAGREIEVAVDEDYFVRSRFYLVGNRLYQVMLGGSKQRAYSRQSEAFLNSLHIMNQTGAPWFTLNLGAMKFGLPGEPERTVKPYHFGSETLRQYTYAWNNHLARLHYLVAYNNYPQDADIHPETLFNQLVFSSTDQLGGYLIKDEAIDQFTYPGRYVEIGTDNGIFYRMLLLYFDHRLYQVMVSGDEEVVYSGLASRLFDLVEIGPWH